MFCSAIGANRGRVDIDSVGAANYGFPTSSSYTGVVAQQLVVSASTWHRWSSARSLSLKGTSVHCPFCRHCDTKVSDSRATEDGSAIRRRRACPACERKFTTVEQIVLTVVKRSGVVESFNREKVIRGVSKACKGRPVTQVQLAELAQRVEESLRASGQAEIPAEQIGVAILGPLEELDAVAYLRFASVYKNYDSVDDFQREIDALRLSALEKDLDSVVPDRVLAQEPLIN